MVTFLRRLGLSLLLPFALAIGTCNAQYGPLFNYSQYPAIQHNVPFHAQSTQVWCWVAVAKMVAEFYGRTSIPNQCAMLQIQYGAPCCQQPQLCMRAGHISEVQALIQRFGGRTSAVSPPANGFALYQALARGPIVMHTTQGSGHFIVATGMRIVATPYGPLGMVSISDPFNGQYEIDFPSLAMQWTSAVVVF
jgi:hypothetical protein